MRKAVVVSSLLLMVLLIISCAGMKKTEVAVVTYESVGVSLRAAAIYITEREKNGTLSGDKLVQYKSIYNQSRAKWLEAGDMLKKAIEDPKTYSQINYQSLLEQAVKLLAQLPVGGK